VGVAKPLSQMDVKSLLGSIQDHLAQQQSMMQTGQAVTTPQINIAMFQQLI